MDNKICCCREFDELRGASVGGYISAFLELAKDAQNRFVCKVCGMNWEKTTTDEVSKSVLTKIDKPKN